MMLTVSNLSTWIKNDQQQQIRIIDDINFTINSGEVFAIIGESGSGKSMTALSIMRILPALASYDTSSKIILEHQDLLNLAEKDMRKIRGAAIAMIFQDPMSSLNPIFTAGQQIVEVLKLHRNLNGRYAYIEALRLLESVKIPNPVRTFKNYPHELSGGMQQRIMIAMALACKPSLLIADEPTTALDVTTQAQILQLLKELQVQENMAMLLITHDLAIASQMADHIAVMQHGKIVEQNTCRNFFAAPQNPYSQKLLNSLPSMLKTERQPVAQPQAMLQVRDLRVHFPIKEGVFRRTVGFVKAVDNVTFNVVRGQTLAIVGESGSGKSTIAKAVLALIPQATGVVEYSSKNLLQLSTQELQTFRSDLQIIFQDPYSSLNSKLRIVDSLEEGMLLQKKLTKEQRHAKIDELLLQVGLLPEYKWRYPHQFSGGERQRICIARALSVDPKIIICDEPTSSLDVSVQAQVLKLLLKLQKERDLAYLFISHDLTVVGLIAHNIAVMKEGKIVEYGTTKQVMEHPQHVYTKALLAAVPTLATIQPIL